MSPMVYAERAVTLLLGGLMLAGLAWGLGGALDDFLTSWVAADRGATPVWAALGVLFTAGWTAVCLHLGPVAVAAPSMQWQASPPRRRTAWPVTALVAGAAASPVAVIAAGARSDAGVEAAVSAAGVVLGVGVAAAVLALIAEYSDGSSVLLAVVHTGAAVAWGMAAWSAGSYVITVLAGVWSLTVWVWSTPRWQWRRPGEVPPRWWLLRGAEHRWAWQAGLTMFDGSVVRAISQRWGQARVGWPRRLPPLSAPTAWIVVRVVRQAPMVFGATVASVGTAYVLAQVAGTTAGVMVVLFGMGVVNMRISGPADAWSDAPALRRTFASVSTARVLSPDVIGLAIPALAGVLVLGPGVVSSLVLLASAMLLVVRRHSARTSPAQGQVSSPAGAVPLDLVDRVIAGWDVIVVGWVVVSMVSAL